MEAEKAQDAKAPARPAMNRTAKTTVIIFFIFMLLHQTDKLLIGPLQTDIMKTFNMSYTQWGFINSGALVVGTLFYPLWGWLSDKYNRAKLSLSSGAPPPGSARLLRAFIARPASLIL